jgi:hypothetical protein
MEISMKNSKTIVLSKLDKKINNLVNEIEMIEEKLLEDYNDNLSKDLEILEKKYSRLITIEERKLR